MTFAFPIAVSPALQDVLDLLPIALPGFAVTVIGILLALAKVAPGLTISIKVLSAIDRGRRALGRGEDERRLIRLRQMFAAHMLGQIHHLDGRERWSDLHFADLEAEVETEGRRRGLRGVLARVTSGEPQGQTVRRRERSLSRALRQSAERLILLRGEPGSGKSVALRHTAREMAEHARTRNTLTAPIPIYLNLKRLDAGDSPIDAKLIERFVQEEMRSGGTSMVDEFIDNHFNQGVADGWWIFLFDSFDEIPGILRSTEVGGAIDEYTDALSAFMHGTNRCHAIIASREFRGLDREWPTFTIQPLDGRHKRDLVRRAHLSRAQENDILAEVLSGPSAVALTAANPMFLGLLCEYVREQHRLPESSHAVFEGYVEQRMRRDGERIQQRFGLAPDSVRLLAENLSFTMLAVDGLGLAPPRDRLVAAMAELGIPVGRNVDVGLNALIYIQLAHEEESHEGEKFTFVHRRFTEYFATCVVNRDPSRVPVTRLLTDGNWRETAVTLLQTQGGGLGPVVDEASALLAGFVAARITAPPGHFAWPPKSLHVLSLLQAAFQGRRAQLPAGISEPASTLVREAVDHGLIVERKQAVQVAGLADEGALLHVLRATLGTASRWLRDVAYRQVALVVPTPADLAAPIRANIVRTYSHGRFASQVLSLRAELARLPDPAPFLAAVRGIRVAQWADAVAYAIAVAFVWRHRPAGEMVAAGVLACGFAATTLRMIVSSWADRPPGWQESGSGQVLWDVAVGPAMLCLRVVVPIAVQLANTDGALSFVNFVVLVCGSLDGTAAIGYLALSARPRPWLVPIAPLALLGIHRVRQSVGAAAGLAAFLGIAIGAFTGVIALVRALHLSLPSVLETVLAVILYGWNIAVFGVLLLSVLMGLWGWMACWQHDRQALRVWRASLETGTTVEKLASMLYALDTAGARLEVLADVRDGSLLSPDPTTAAELRDLLGRLEAGWDAQLPQAPSSIRDPSQWVIRQRAARRTDLDTPELIDALGRAVEQLERTMANRVATAPAPSTGSLA